MTTVRFNSDPDCNEADFKVDNFGYLLNLELLKVWPLSHKKAQVALGRERIANVVLYFGTHLEPAALQVYELFPLSHWF